MNHLKRIAIKYDKISLAFNVLRLKSYNTFKKKYKMKIHQVFVLCLLMLFSSCVFSYAGTKNVTFLNNSPKLLKCWIKKNNDYIPFIRLEPGKSKSFEDFKLNSDVRCSTEIEKNHSTTMLTYFSIKTEGVYELLQERVSCESCPSKIRWATIVTFPNGDAFYNKWD